MIQQTVSKLIRQFERSNASLFFTSIRSFATINIDEYDAHFFQEHDRIVQLYKNRQIEPNTLDHTMNDLANYSLHLSKHKEYLEGLVILEDYLESNATKGDINQLYSILTNLLGLGFTMETVEKNRRLVVNLSERETEVEDFERFIPILADYIASNRLSGCEVFFRKVNYLLGSGKLSITSKIDAIKALMQPDSGYEKEASEALREIETSDLSDIGGSNVYFLTELLCAHSRPEVIRKAAKLLVERKETLNRVVVADSLALLLPHEVLGQEELMQLISYVNYQKLPMNTRISVAGGLLAAMANNNVLRDFYNENFFYFKGWPKVSEKLVNSFAEARKEGNDTQEFLINNASALDLNFRIFLDPKGSNNEAFQDYTTGYGLKE